MLGINIILNIKSSLYFFRLLSVLQTSELFNLIIIELFEKMR
jgi:hypothetical protein